MRVQATSFRLPALKLQPKDSYQCLSYGDNNLSNSSMIKYQSSPLRNYDPSPIKKRVRGMTIAIYNSQEKLKTADYRNGGEFITQIQQANQSTSVVNTFRRYRSKLKQLMQPSKDDGVNSRDPRLYSFKDTSATIRLDRLNNDRKDQQIQDKVKNLVGKVRLLFSTQQFYQEPLQQDTFQVKLVKLKDEYDCLYQDFNDYYVQNNKLDKQVLQLLNHMEIIKTLLKPKQPIKIRKYQQPEITQPEYQSPIIEAQEIIEETPQQSLIVEHPLLSPKEPHQQQTHEQFREPSLFTPLTSKQSNNDQSISDLEQDQPNKINLPKKKKVKIKNSPQKSQKTIIVQQSILDLNVLEDLNLQSQQTLSQPKLKQILTPQNNQGQSVNINDIQEAIQNESEDNSTLIEKPALKRTISNLGSTSKRRNTVLENKEGQKKQKKVGTISEQDDSNQEEDEQQNQLKEIQTEQNDDEQQQKEKINLELTLIDLLIASQNIYKYPFYQHWEFHIVEIIKGTSFGEFDL